MFHHIEADHSSEQQIVRGNAAQCGVWPCALLHINSDLIVSDEMRVLQFIVVAGTRRTCPIY